MECTSCDIVGARSNVDYVVVRVVCLSHCCIFVTGVFMGVRVRGVGRGEVMEKCTSSMFETTFPVCISDLYLRKDVKVVKVLCVAKQLCCLKITLDQKSY